METDNLKKEITNLFNKINDNLINEDKSLTMYTEKLYAELTNLLYIYEIEYNKHTLKDLVNTYVFYQIKAKLNIYKNQIRNINENIYHYFDRGLNIGFNELECNDKIRMYLSRVNEANTGSLNNEIKYEDIFTNIKKIIINELKIENQQFMYQLENIMNINKSLLGLDINRIRKENLTNCKEICNLLMKLGKINNKGNIDIDSQMVFIKQLLLDINNKNKPINQNKLNEIFSNEIKEFLKMISKITRNIENQQDFIKDTTIIFNKELERTYIKFYNDLDDSVIPKLIKDSLEIIKDDKRVNISRNSKLMNIINNFSSENDLVDMDVIFVNIEELLMTKYGLSRSHPKFSKVFQIINLEKSKLENEVERVESYILFGVIIELQSQIDKILKNKNINNSLS